MRRFLIFVILSAILSVGMVNAATVKGTIYDTLLNLQENAIVEVDSTPKQTLISKDGQYSFELPIGDYVITAKYMENEQLIASASENISIVDYGTFVLDLILFESTEEEFELLDTPLIDIETEEEGISALLVISIVLLVLALIAGVIFYIKRLPLVKEIEEEEGSKSPKISEDGLGEVISIMASAGGRITQKDLRKKLNLSEAKISLMVAELESMGKVKKIKQGRGNILIMQK